jgi:hypothetical protein
MILFLACSTISIYGQADRNVIKGAASTAQGAIKTDQKKLPDSLKWKTGGDVSVNFSQTSFSNWSGGGENSITLNSTMNLFANYKKNKVLWENNTYLAYGLAKTGNTKMIKNNDQINFGSRVSYNMAKSWYYSAALLAKTQFTTGYKYSATDTTRISDFLAPVYLYLSLGLNYKPSNKFSMALSPLMGKSTLVRLDDENVMRTAGLTQELIDKGKKSRYEFGGGIIFNLNGSVFEKRITYLTQIELFSNYLENLQNIDVIWDFQFRIALTKFVSARVDINMVYDDNQKTSVRVQKNGEWVNTMAGPRLQVKQFFQIGFYYDF